ncbi:MAG: hypothetical protein KY464_08820 [Gemmatimonadetes bacterium]|nr:hypothetical protein [Gemmatimonadota bacterium]
MRFPLQLRFRTFAVSPQALVTDDAGQLVFYVKQKAFRLKEAITVFSDEEQTRPLYRIAADRVIDLSASYHFEDEAGNPLGLLKRLGMRSLWRASYEVHRGGGPVLAIGEENPWVKVVDGLIGEIPVVGMLSGFILHPAYRVTRADNGAPVLRVVKQPALLEGKYTIEQLDELGDADTALAVLAVLMMLLLERRRG